MNLLRRFTHVSKRRMVVAAAVLLATTSAAAQTVVELKATHFLPPNHTFHKELLRWGEELALKSNGRLKLTVFPSSQMGPPSRQFDLVRTGVADIGVALTGLTPGRFPMTEVSNLPFVCPSSAFCSRRVSELAPKFLTSEYSGVKLLQVVMTSPLVLHLSKTKIEKVSDFKGLRIRYAGELLAQSLKAFGGTPVAVPPGDVVDAMSKGTIDGALFPYEGAQSFQLGTATKFSMQPGVNTASFFWIMNRATFDKLPKDLQALIEQTTGPTSAENIGKMLDVAEDTGRAYMKEKGVTIVDLSASTQRDMKAAVQPEIDNYLKELEAKGQPANQFYEALTKGNSR